MILKNGFVLDKSFRFVKTDVCFSNGKITSVGECDKGGESVDCTGKYIIPGLVDIHTHGCGGADACDGTKNALDVLSKTQGKAGVTSFCATTMTMPKETLDKVFTEIGSYMKSKPAGAHIIGINMEGPFFNESKKGAQRGDCLKLPSYEFFSELNALCGNNVRLVDMAPELDGSTEFIKEASKTTLVSIGHTASDYATAMKAIHAGASHVTHLYNAMNGFTHRAPGIVGAASDSNVTVELISDGIHIDPCVVRATFKLMPDRVCLISDSMAATGMPNGEYELGGQAVFVTDKKAVLADGTIAGSSTNLMDCMKKAVEFGIPLATAVKSASFIPARAIGLSKQIGSIDVNLDADVVVLDKDLNVEKIFIKGELY